MMSLKNPAEPRGFGGELISLQPSTPQTTPAEDFSQANFLKGASMGVVAI